MNEIIKDIGKGLIGMLGVVFLPKQILIGIREVITFGLKSFLRYWKSNALLILVISIILVKGNLINQHSDTLILVAITITIVLLSITRNIVNMYITLNRQDSLVIYGCYSTKEKEYLFLDLDAELINDRLRKECENLSKDLFIHKSKVLPINFHEFPKFIPVVLGYKGTVKLFESFIAKRKHISSLYYIRDITDQKIITTLNCDQSFFFHAEIIQILSSLQDKISNEKIDIKEIAVINLKLFILVFGQSFINYFAKSKDYQSLNQMIDDSEKLLFAVKTQMGNNGINDIQEFKSFFNFWTSYLYRLKGVLLLEQNELNGAIKYIISSVKSNPYFPYYSYQTFKSNFAKRYGLEISYSIEEQYKNQDIKDEINFSLLRQSIKDSIQSPEIEFNSKYIIEIIKRDTKQTSLKYLENEINTLDEKDPAILLFKSDILKYLPDGSEKVNEIYYGRIEKTINLLNEILKIDNNFPIIKSKIGSLMITKAFHDNDEQEIENAMKVWTEGMHFLTELGIK